jgi:hypothetical protein
LADRPVFFVVPRENLPTDLLVKGDGSPVHSAPCLWYENFQSTDSGKFFDKNESRMNQEFKVANFEGYAHRV